MSTVWMTAQNKWLRPRNRVAVNRHNREKRRILYKMPGVKLEIPSFNSAFDLAIFL